MNIVKIYKTEDIHTNISPLGVHRDWMKENDPAYHCFPVTLTNKFGYGISFPEDISFVWHGNSAPGLDGDIEVLEGKSYCEFGRGGGVIVFPTNLIFKTDKDLSILTMPVPNQFIDGAQCFTSILSSSFFTGPLSVVWKVTTPNKIIKIPANTPVASIIPISVKGVQDTKLIISNEKAEIVHGKEYIDAMFEYGKINQRVTGWYKKGLDHLSRKIGDHEVKSLKLKVETQEEK